MNTTFVEIVQKDVKTQDSIDLGYGFRRGNDSSNYKGQIQTSGYTLDFIQLDSDTETQVLNETEDWIVEEYHTEHAYNEVYECGTKSESLKNVPVKSFGGHIVVKDGHFYGIALWTEQKGGNGWNGSNYGNHCLLLVDGSIYGTNQKYDSFSGEEHSRRSFYTYTLKRKSEAQEPYSKSWVI